jgi:hypothetical protein
MESVFEVIVEVILLVLFRYPGAFVRWAITGFRSPFKKFLDGDTYLNGTIGLVVIVLLIVLIKKLI